MRILIRQRIHRKKPTQPWVVHSVGIIHRISFSLEFIILFLSLESHTVIFPQTILQKVAVFELNTKRAVVCSASYTDHTAKSPVLGYFLGVEWKIILKHFRSFL